MRCGVWYGVVWYGMVWYGMVWYGMVWYGMVWSCVGQSALIVARDLVFGWNVLANQEHCVRKYFTEVAK